MGTILNKDREFLEVERKEMEQIASSDNDYPVLMINQNRYKEGEFPNGDLYLKWRSVNKKMIDDVNGKIIWTIPIKGPIVVYGHLERLDEILAYWYPSHKSFLNLVNSSHRTENLKIREDLISYAVIHRCDGRNVPQIK